MKLFQRLLVAPAALGLMAPIAANADVTSVSTDSSLNSEVLQARVDGVEAQLGEIQAGQFSSSTKMSGKAAFILGYVDDDAESDTDAITGEYMYQLNMNTSFTGEDNLYARIKTGNVADHFKDTNQGTYLSATNKNDNSLKIDKLWYQFPVGDSLQVWVGPKIENYYMLASAPSIYRPVLKQFALGGNGSAYGSSTSPGFGVAWTQEVDDPSSARWAVSANYTSKDGDHSDGDEGMFGEKTTNFVMTKIEYGAPRWQVSLATSFKENGAKDYDGYFHSALAESPGDITAYALRGYWKPETTGAVPAIQVGYDTATMDSPSAGEAEDTAGWMVGLGWKDVFIDGNSAGLAIGSRMAATNIKGGGTDPAEDNSVWEAYYTFRVNDGVSVTPAIFGGSDVQEAGKDYTGAVLLTEFRF
tara:strand:- start:791 stop:2035 length:1245 start_codon:yes stop_codon:yes gene_type:complete